MLRELGIPKKGVRMHLWCMHNPSCQSLTVHTVKFVSYEKETVTFTQECEHCFQNNKECKPIEVTKQVKEYNYLAMDALATRKGDNKL